MNFARFGESCGANSRLALGKKGGAALQEQERVSVVVFGYGVDTEWIRSGDGVVPVGAAVVAFNA